MPLLQALRRAYSSSQAVAVQPPHQKIWIRYPSDLEAFCWVPEAGDDLACSGKIWRIWDQGITLLCREHLPQGTVVHLCVRSGFRSLTGRLEATITRVTFDPAGYACIDCEFVQPLSQQDRSVLL